MVKFCNIHRLPNLSSNSPEDRRSAPRGIPLAADHASCSPLGPCDVRGVILHLRSGCLPQAGPSLPGCSLGKYPRQHYPSQSQVPYGSRPASPGFRNEYLTESARGSTSSCKDFENALFRVCQTVLVTLTRNSTLRLISKEKGSWSICSRSARWVR